MQWVKVASLADIPEGEMLGVTVGERHVALYNLGGTIHATDNVCTHAFALLTDGWLDGEEIECPIHGGRFDVRTGKGLGPPIKCDLAVFPVRVTDQDIEIALPPA